MTHSKKNIIHTCLLALCVGVTAFSAYAVAVRGDGRDGAGGRGGLRGAQPQSQKRAHRALPEQQTRALEQAKFEGVGVMWGEQMQSPLSVRGQDLGARRAFSGGRGLQVRRGAPWRDNAIAVMDNLSPLFGITDAEAEFEVKRVDEDKLGFRHVRLTQRHQGLKVVGGELIVHFNRDEAAYEVNGQYAPAIAVGTRPGLTANAATKVAQDDVTEMGFIETVIAKVAELVVYAMNGAEPRLAWELTLVGRDSDGRRPASWCYWVDAQTGDVLMKFNDVKHIDTPTEAGTPAEIQGNILIGEGGNRVTVEGWLENGAYYLYNPISTWLIYNMSPNTNLYPIDADTYAHRFTDDWGTSDRTEMSAAYNIDQTLHYFREVHERDSYDNNSALVRVNVHESPAVNAYWWGGDVSQIFIGDGGDGTYSLAVLDVVAHEFVHAVIEHSANLVYAYEPGALNESFCDIFAACVEFYVQPDGRDAYPWATPGTANWLIGEDTAPFSFGAIRDMRNPQRYWQPSRYLGTIWWDNPGDNGGVHYNSGPMNFFFYLLCEGGEGVNDELPYNVEGIGIERAAQIAYRVLTVYCTRYTGYLAVREAWYSATRDLFPECLTSVRHAWDAVMGEQPPPIIRPDSLPDGRVGNFYSLPFSAVTPSPVYEWYHIDGDLPPMLTFSSGRLNGYCTQVGTYTFSIAVEANNGLITTNEFSVFVRSPYEAPLAETFEYEMEDAFTGWSQRHIYGGVSWRVRSGGIIQNRPSAAIEGTKNAYLGMFNDSGTLNLPEHETWLISPMITFGPNARAAQLRFHLYMEKWGLLQDQDELRVYYRTSVFEEWGDPIATYTSSVTPWSLQVIDLPFPLPDGHEGYFIAFGGTALGGTGICIDNIWIGDPIPPLSILTPPILPVALVETNYTNLVTLQAEGGWSTDPGEYTYEVIGGTMPEGFGLTPDGVVTGLSMVVQSGTFLVQVTDSQGRTATLEMTLLVELPRAPVFEDDFERTSLVGWTQEWHPQTSSNIRWTIQRRGGHGNGLPLNDAHSPTRFAWFYGVHSGNAIMRVKLVSKPFDLSQAPNNTRLSFWHFMQQEGGKQDQLNVFYRTSASSPWVLLENYKENVTNWTHRVIQLPNLSSTYQIAFEGNALGGTGVAIDSVSITDDAAAPIITTLPTLPGSFRGFSYYTALTAVGGMPSYAWSLVSGALPPGLTLNADGEISGTATVATLATFSIAVTGADGKASTNNFSLRILPPGNVPFEEKFDSPTLPDGWVVERVQGNVDWVIARGTISPNASALPKAPPPNMELNACLWSQNAGTTIARLISPPINLGKVDGSAVLTFQHCMAHYFSSYDRLLVRYRTSLTDDWKTIADFTATTLQWTPRTVTLPNPSSTYYIAFEGHARGGHGICVGDVVIMGDIRLTPFEEWQREHFTEEELNDPSISGPDADPDGDGIPNLMEYAMGLDPKSPDANVWIWGGLTNVVDYAGFPPVPTGNYLYLKYRRANEVKGVRFTVIGTPSLMPPDLDWQPFNIQELEPWTPGTEPDVWSWVHNIHLVPSTNAPMRFMRLRLELEE